MVKFSQNFKTPEALEAAQNEWKPEIESLTRDEIDKGMIKVRSFRVDKNPDFEWPDIAITIAVCRDNYKTAKTSEQQRLRTIKEAHERTVAREFRLEDKGAQDRAKKARDSAMKDWRAKLAL